MMFVPSAIVVPGDAAATAARLVASESLFRLGLLGDATIAVSEVALTAVLYVLLRPAGRALALAATFARLAMAVIQGVNLLPQLAALYLAGGARDLGAFDQAQRQALALFALDVHGQGAHVWEIFFGLHCSLVAALVLRSRFLPRTLGVLMVFAAVGYWVNGLGSLVMPAGAHVFAAMVSVGAMIGELPFLAWLLIRGVDAQHWSADA
jgi:hypothetical protein